MAIKATDRELQNERVMKVINRYICSGLYHKALETSDVLPNGEQKTHLKRFLNKLIVIKNGGK